MERKERGRSGEGGEREIGEREEGGRERQIQKEIESDSDRKKD